MEKTKPTSYTVKFSGLTTSKLRKLKVERMLNSHPIKDIQDLIPEIIDDNIDKYLETTPNSI